jgi:hypothetical protein
VTRCGAAVRVVTRACCQSGAINDAVRLSEAININLGLLALQVPYRNIIITVIISQLLQSCIAALADKSRHPPFNDR